LDVTSSNLGTVMATQQVNDLPLNGRNFTQLLQLTPGVVPINTGQSNGGGFSGPPAAQGSSFTFPAINGQTNRSNFYLTDGLVNYGSVLSTYAVPPIIDAIQEFKIVSHTDSAEYGSVLGGVVNVVTKSGTNSLHGTLWEYIRNDAFDASLPLTQTNPPFRQNQFGASAGGPVVIPKLYNGRNKTFFFGAYQGFRYTKPNDNPLLVPTAAQLAGDESDWPTQIYNPFSTQPRSSSSGAIYSRSISRKSDPDRTDQSGDGSLRSVRLSQGRRDLSPAPRTMPSILLPVQQTQNEWTARVDQTIGAKKLRVVPLQLYQLHHHAVRRRPRSSEHDRDSRPQLGRQLRAYLSAPAWFSRSMRPTRPFSTMKSTRFATSSASIFSQVGFSTAFAGSFNADGGGNLLPNPGISGYADGGESVQNTPKATDSTQVSGAVTKILGNHELHFGGGYISNTFASPIAYANLGFAAQQTGNPERFQPARRSHRFLHSRRSKQRQPPQRE
jgi:hypothetical protein